MSFLYPRRVTLHRPTPETGVGWQAGYSGLQAVNETAYATGLPASIQNRREGQKSPTALPADGNQTVWWIFIPRTALALGSVLDRDIVIDELGQRFQVVANYWNSLGYRLSCYRLEA